MTRLLANKSVLILGEDTRSFLSVIRSLGESGMKVDVVTLINNTPSLYSKWIQKVYKLNYQAYSQEEWQQSLSKIIEVGNYDLVIPCDERSLYPLLDIKDQTKTKAIFAIPERHALGPLFDKEQTKSLASKLGISVAHGELFSLETTSTDDLIKKFGLPLVLKPTMSYESGQLSQRNTVMIARTQGDVEAFRQSNNDCLVESYFTGTGMGVSVFASKGKIRAAFAHRRVSEPERGGGSSYRKAWPLSPDMLDACQKICVHLNYTGVAMFEFKFNDTTKKWILIEINARFWGSLPLAIFAGVDFPKLLAIYLMTELKPYKLTYNPRAHARSLTSDIYDMKASFDACRYEDGLLRALSCTLPRILGFVRLFTGNDTVDSFKWNDKQPFFKELDDLFGKKLKSLFTLNKSSALLRKKHSNLPTAPISELVVICYGNIMRSPFATELLKAKLQKENVTVNVVGAGFHQREGRCSPARCVLQAANWSVDLSSHRSKWLSQSMIKPKGQLIVYFDLKHEYLLESYYDNYTAINLAHFIPSPHGPMQEIPDPYDASDRALTECYTNINSAVDTFVSELLNSGILIKNTCTDGSDRLVFSK